MLYGVVADVAYLVISIGIAVWVGRTLHKNGRVFLVDAFGGREVLADSVNHLLVVGFYLVNLGFVAMYLDAASPPETLLRLVPQVSKRVGTVLLVLGGMHFFNLYVFSRIRRRAVLRNDVPPVEPQHTIPGSEASWREVAPRAAHHA